MRSICIVNFLFENYGIAFENEACSFCPVDLLNYRNIISRVLINDVIIKFRIYSVEQIISTREEIYNDVNSYYKRCKNNSFIINYFSLNIQLVIYYNYPVDNA